MNKLPTFSTHHRLLNTVAFIICFVYSYIVLMHKCLYLAALALLLAYNWLQCTIFRLLWDLVRTFFSKVDYIFFLALTTHTFGQASIAKTTKCSSRLTSNYAAWNIDLISWEEHFLRVFVQRRENSPPNANQGPSIATIAIHVPIGLDGLFFLLSYSCILKNFTYYSYHTT